MAAGGRSPSLHDWTLLAIRIEWRDGLVEFMIKGHEQSVVLRAEGLVELHVPRRFEWGPSESINRLNEPVKLESGLQVVEIEMQSGDSIKITAASFQQNFTKASLSS